jgi:hypothetical protein
LWPGNSNADLADLAQVEDIARPYNFRKQYGDITFKGPVVWKPPRDRLTEIRTAAGNVLNELTRTIPLPRANRVLLQAIRKHRFVGGASFWHTTRTLFGQDSNGKPKDAPFQYIEFKQEILDTVDLTWAILTGPRKDEKKHKEEFLERAWFSAQWIDCVLIDGFGLELANAGTADMLVGEVDPYTRDEIVHLGRGNDSGLSFQPYNGPKGAELSWTLGKAVLLATRNPEPRSMSLNDAVIKKRFSNWFSNRGFLIIDLKAKSKDLGYRCQSYQARANAASGQAKVEFQRKADICERHATHYQQQADLITDAEHAYIPPDREAGDEFLHVAV